MQRGTDSFGRVCGYRKEWTAVKIAVCKKKIAVQHELIVEILGLLMSVRSACFKVQEKRIAQQKSGCFPLSLSYFCNILESKDVFCTKHGCLSEGRLYDSR